LVRLARSASAAGQPAQRFLEAVERTRPAHVRDAQELAARLRDKIAAVPGNAYWRGLRVD